MNNSHAVVVFAKVPGLGIAKSRIAATEGPAAAARIYEELLVAASACLGQRAYYVAFAGDNEPGRLEEFFPHAVSFFPQKGRGLGERLRNAFLHLFGLGLRRACAVGCDCPDMTPDDISQAFSALDTGTDVVLGPAHDGGYYLVGIAPGNEYVFSVGAWGTSELLARTMKAVEVRGAVCRLLRPLRDIDTIDDYHAWKRETDCRSGLFKNSPQRHDTKIEKRGAR